MPTVEPAPGIHSFALEDGCLLFSEARQELHALNLSATAIWRLLQDGEEAAGIADRLQESFGLSAKDASDFVQAAFADWRARGFLTGSTVEEAPAVMPPRELPHDIPPYCAPASAVEHCYALLGLRLRIRFTTPEQAKLVLPVLAHLACQDSGIDTVLDVVQRGNGQILYRDGEECGSCEAEGLAPLVKSLVWAAAVNHHAFFLGIHAGVVGGRAGAVLLPGNPGSGKSSLTAALIHAGFRYFSDEMALLRDGDFHVLPVPLSLCIKDSGLEVLASRFPVLRELPVHLRADGKRVTYLPPPRNSLPEPGAAPPVQAIIFPSYVADASTCCRTIPKTDALQRLMGQCIVVRQRLDPERVQALVRWLDGVPCFELCFGSLAEGAGAAANILNAGNCSPDVPAWDPPREPVGKVGLR